jgi:hypothetical protein
MKFEGKIKKSDFESKLYETVEEMGFKDDELSCSPYIENGKRLTLYYIQGGHAGTWIKGEGWIFDIEKIKHHIDTTPK